MKDTIRTFNRFELKYILPLEVAKQIKQEIQPYVLPDPHGDGGKYALASLYFDTHDYKFYWEKMEGIKFRRKLRIRWYQTDKPLTDDSLVFLEIKQRYDRVVQKKRVPMKYREALDFCHRRIIPKHDSQDAPVIQEIYSMLKLYSLHSKLVTIYDRQAFVGTKYDMGLRITFDTMVGYRSNHLELGAKTSEGYIVPANYVVMEIKVNEKLPIWVANMVSKNNLRGIRISKYCRGLNMASITPNFVYNS